MAEKPVVDLARLQALLDEKKWGIGELSTYSRVKYDTVYSLVKGRRANTSSRTLAPVAKALGVTVDYLVGKSDTRGVVVPDVPESIRRLTDVAGTLSEVRQEELLRIAFALAELEREQTQNAPSPETMRILGELAAQLKSDGENENLLAYLRDVLRNPPPRWLIDLRPADPDQPPDDPSEGD